MSQSFGQVQEDVEEIFYSRPEYPVRRGNKIIFDCEASVNRYHPMIWQPRTNWDKTDNERGLRVRMKDWYAKPELEAWLKQRPYDVYYRGTRIVFRLTKKDMALFKVFWG